MMVQLTFTLQGTDPQQQIKFIRASNGPVKIELSSANNEIAVHQSDLVRMLRHLALEVEAPNEPPFYSNLDDGGPR